MCSSIFLFSSSVASKELRASSPNSFLRVADTVSPASTMPWGGREGGRSVGGFFKVVCFGM